MELARLVAGALSRGGFSSEFAGVPSALDAEAPIVLREGPFERGARMEGEERGTVAIAALVVRDEAARAEGDARACERIVRATPWDALGEAAGWRVRGLDTSAPRDAGRDGSGRYLWAFDVVLSVARML